ncbi:MAG: ATP-binding protein [Nitrososphaerota archaeon]|nr:ATP-binding protein [Aigarchaeota archaeon]MDW8076949.1 ATP-binding protein [Nitrososphaerota archaeon]
MKNIGIVASHATESRVTVILNEGMEKEVESESLVLVENRNGGKILAVCRSGVGINDVLRATIYSPGVAYAKAGRQPSSAKEFFGFNLVIIGDVSKGKIEQNKRIIAPASPVMLFEKHDDPFSYFGSNTLKIGHYKDVKNWQVPVRSEYIPFHIGVFGVTGSGKSFFCRYELIPLLRRAGYDVLVFDWKGSDYAPYFDGSISMHDIEMDDEAVISFLCSKAGNFGSGRIAETMRAYIEEALADSEWKMHPPEEAKKSLYLKVARVIEDENRDKQGNITQWGRLYLRRLDKGFKRITAEDFATVLGKMGPEQIVERLRQQNILVIDMSLGSKEQKLSVFLSIARYLKDLMEKKNRLDIAILIDEAPQYCPYLPRGLEEETTEMITSLCALGRTYGLSIILLSQGIAGEIGINAAVRRNLNTQFIGRIHPLDLEEAAKLFAMSGVDPENLLRLPEGYFYFVGKMNPSPIPLLLSFQIREDEKIGRSSRA